MFDIRPKLNFQIVLQPEDSCLSSFGIKSLLSKRSVNQHFDLSTPDPPSCILIFSNHNAPEPEGRVGDDLVIGRVR